MQVVHKTFGQGTVISQDDNNITVQFSEVTKTLIKRFAGLTDLSGAPIVAVVEAAPKKSKSAALQTKNRAEVAKFDAMSNLDKIKSALMSINGKVEGDRSSLGYKIWDERISNILSVAEKVGDSFIVSVIESCCKYWSCSEKQAYVIARFADNNNIKY